MGIFDKITLTRLMVGHTHIDVDGFFGRFWKYIRALFVLTAVKYALLIIKALSTPGHKCYVTDVYCVPDYTSFFEGHIDPLFGSYCKGEKSQLQFRFERTEKCKDFPLGVKTTYRKYAGDNALEIVHEEGTTDKLVNLTVRQVEVSWYPSLKIGPNGDVIEPEGMYILQSLPEGSLKPKGFVSGSKSIFDTVFNSVKRAYQKKMSSVVE